MSHGVNIRPDQKEAWAVDGVYGYVYVYDITSLPPKHIADVPLFQNPPNGRIRVGSRSVSTESMHIRTAAP